MSEQNNSSNFESPSGTPIQNPTGVGPTSPPSPGATPVGNAGAQRVVYGDPANQTQPPAQPAPNNGGRVGEALTLDDIMPRRDEEIKIPVRPRGTSDKSTVGYVVLRMNDPKTMRKFRNIYSGGLGSRKTQPLEANNFLLDEKFIRVENLNLPSIQNGYDSDLTWMKFDSEGQFFAEFVIGEYLTLTQPDTTDLRKS